MDKDIDFERFPFGREGWPREELAAPETQGAQALYELWRAKLPDDGFPRKADFKPTDMKKYLSHIYIIDVLDGGKDFKIRLFGSDLATMLGRDYTGILLSETPPELNWRGEIYALAVFRKAPIFYSFELGPFGRDTIVTENAVFPMANSKGELAHLLCFAVEVGRVSVERQLSMLTKPS